jgi:3-isopropylmalate/(R)-2-methylmalate dehydratase small subunit
LEKFQRLDAVAVPIAQPNVDTDQVIPSRYLQKPRSTDFGPLLFRDVRVAQDGTPRDFILDRPAYGGARIVVAERNFGCGSSREQAVWALFDYGIRAVIAPSLGDIFRSNSLKNGLLPVILPEPVVMRMLASLAARPGAHVTVDLAQQTVVDPDGNGHAFDIDPFPKHCLLEGLDEIAYTLTLMDRIVAFERTTEAS